jgi:aspartyl-tRNA(Asn)/glutamyl-tRNA(Gln) amidotransferase subunit A
MGSSLDSPGVMANSVMDAAALAGIMSGRDEKDSTTGHGEVPQYHKNLKTDLKGVKVGVPKEYFVEGLGEQAKQRVMDAIKVLEERGATIVDVSLPNTKYGSLVYAIICPSEVSSNLARFDGIRYGHTVHQTAKNLMEVYGQSRAEGFGDEAKRRIMTGTYVLSAGYYDAYYKKAQKVRRLIIDEFAEVFKKVDILVAPSTPSVAQKLGHAADDPLFGYIVDQLHIPSSLAGLPAIAFPCGFAKPDDGETPSKDGLPVGIQVIGPQWGEQKVFDVAYAYQQATDWHKKHPSLE